MQPQLFDSTPYDRTETGALHRPRSSRVVDRLRSQNSEVESQNPSTPRRQAMEETGRHVAEEMQGRKPVVRAHSGAAVAILRGGRFRTQFETGESNGSYDPEYRSRHEERMFGLSAQTPPAARPVYGYLQAPEGHPNRTTEEASARSYGNVEFTMNPERIEHRATTTFGDSLGSRDPAVPLQDARSGQHIPEEFVPHYSGVDHGPKQRYQPSTYYEMQIHGGVSTRDVSRMDINMGKWDDDDDYLAGRAMQEAQHQGISYAQRRVTQTYQQGGMITQGLSRYDSNLSKERAITEDAPWGETPPEVSGGFARRGAEHQAYMPYMGPEVKDTLSIEQWQPGMRQPMFRQAYPVPKSGEIASPSDRF